MEKNLSPPPSFPPKQKWTFRKTGQVLPSYSPPDWNSEGGVVEDNKTGV